MESGNHWITPKTAHRKCPRLSIVTSDVGSRYSKAEVASPIPYNSTGYLSNFESSCYRRDVAPDFVLFDRLLLEFQHSCQSPN